MDEIKELLERIAADTNPVHASRAAHALIGAKIGEALQRVNELQRQVQLAMENLLQLNEHLANAVPAGINPEDHQPKLNPPAS